MSVFQDVRLDVAAKLTAAGLPRVTLDPASVPPFILIDAFTRSTAAEGPGAWRCELPVRIVVPPPGDVAGLTALQDALEAVLVTLGWAPFEAERIDTGARTIDGDAVTLPAYTVTYPMSVPNPNC